MSERYQIISTNANDQLPSSAELARFLAKDGQLLLPMLDLIEQAQCAIDDVVDVMGRATIEAILQMSAAQLAGPKQQGKRATRDIAYHGTQAGRVALKERQLRVEKPRLRKKRRGEGEPGEVEIPAYTALQKDERLADRGHGKDRREREHAHQCGGFHAPARQQRADGEEHDRGRPDGEERSAHERGPARWQRHRRRPCRGRSGSVDDPAPVDEEVDAVDGRVVDEDLRAVGACDLVLDARRGGEQGDAVLALEPLLHDLHV